MSQTRNQTRFDIKDALHASVGVTDLAVEVVRDYVGQTVELTQQRLTGLQKSVTAFEPKAPRVAIEKRVARLQSDAAAVPARLQKSFDTNVSAATDAYVELVKRGETLVGRIRRQQSTQDAVQAAETTVAKAKTTRTQTTKAAKASKTTTTRKRAAASSSAKATRTSAKKTVSAGSRALADAAQKIGD